MLTQLLQKSGIGKNTFRNIKEPRIIHNPKKWYNNIPEFSDLQDEVKQKCNNEQEKFDVTQRHAELISAFLQV